MYSLSEGKTLKQHSTGSSPGSLLDMRHKDLLDALPAICAYIDKNLCYQYVNAAYETWSAMNAASIIGKPAQEVLGKEAFAAMKPHMDRVLSGQQVRFETTLYNNKKGLRHLDVFFTPVADAGQVAGYTVLIYDRTTEEKPAENTGPGMPKESGHKNIEVKLSEERFHRMVNEVQDYAIIMLDADGIIKNWNKGAEKIKGYKAGEAIDRHFSIFYTPEDRQRGLPEALINEAHNSGRAGYEGWRVRKDGSFFWGSVVITAIHDEDNNVIGFSKVTRDLTERKCMEDSLIEKNKELESMNQELGAFAYVSSHDLQEPLRKIQTFASRIMEKEYGSLSERGKDYFDRMHKAAIRMQALIDDLLNYSRAKTIERKFEWVDMNVLLQDVKNELAEAIEEKNAVIESGPLPELLVISFQFRQLFTNLIGNALKFSKQETRPRIVLRNHRVKGDGIPGTANPDEDYHCIEIQDNGIGFNPRYAEKIFEAFQRLHSRMEYTGTGIGLSLCKRIVENHNGVITADSRENEGTTFRIYLPVQVRGEFGGAGS